MCHVLHVTGGDTQHQCTQQHDESCGGGMSCILFVCTITEDRHTCEAQGPYLTHRQQCNTLNPPASPPARMRVCARSRAHTHTHTHTHAHTHTHTHAHTHTHTYTHSGGIQ
jgi:hypothetical protein